MFFGKEQNSLIYDFWNFPYKIANIWMNVVSLIVENTLLLNIK